MSPTKHTWLVAASMAILCAASLGRAETLQEMEMIDHGMAMVVVRNPEIGVLIVESVIPELSFESNMGIIKVEQTRPGEWILHLYPGTNLITFKAEGYKAVSDVRLVVPKKKARKVEIKPLITLGTLMVESDPPGAQIFLDGEDTGEQTPHRFENQTAEKHQLVLKRTSYRSDTTMVDLKAGETKTLSRPLQAIGYLTLHTDPSEAQVVIDSGTEEVLTVSTPIEVLALKTGVYSLSVYKPGYLSPQLSVTIEKGKIVQKDLELQAEGEAGLKVKPKKSRKWLWIVSGVAVVAGGVAAVMLTGSKSSCGGRRLHPAAADSSVGRRSMRSALSASYISLTSFPRSWVGT